MPRKKRKNKGPRSGKLRKALCDNDVNGRGKLYLLFIRLDFRRFLEVCDPLISQTAALVIAPSIAFDKT